MAENKTNRRTERTWVPGKGWVTSGIGAAEGANDTSATERARLGDTRGLGSVKSKPWPKRQDFATEEEWQKAYDARMQEQRGGGAPNPTPTRVPVSDVAPMTMPGMMPAPVPVAMGPGFNEPMPIGGEMDPQAVAQMLAQEELRRRFGSNLLLGPLYGGTA